ncbi:response regulator [Opitutus sp. ER46]|uniref:response regulator transcription factor n=1 Tax=Opitutus sp. ER46 TaxID=2161864 RepID=UPI000D307146|nr:response regulator [Opitutus sp. ER46]PTX90705.1 two-component system response regulator [Opitutus sp. ER46]
MAKVLVADDSATAVALLQNAVSEAGHVSLVATNGDDAMRLAVAEKPALILLDVVMPKVDGFQVCRRLRKQPETASTPIVIVTSKDQETDKFWGIRQGANDYITKPFEPKALADLIRKHIG